MVTRTSGAASISARTSSNSTAESIGTSSSSSGNARYVSAASAAASNSVAAIGRRGGGELILEARQQPRQVRPTERQRIEPRGVDPREHQLVQRSRQRAREPWCARHRPEVRELLVARRLERGARRDRFAADERHRRDAARRHDRRRESGGELGQAEAMQANRAAPCERDRPRQVVGRAARRGHDQDAGAVRARGDPRAGFGQPRRGVRGFDEAEGRMGQHVNPFPGRRAGSPLQPRTAAVRTTITRSPQWNGSTGSKGSGVRQVLVRQVRRVRPVHGPDGQTRTAQGPRPKAKSLSCASAPCAAVTA